MTFFCFCHAQKNAFAFLVPLSFRQITIGLCGLDFRLPIALCDFNRLLSLVLLGGHAKLKRKTCRLPHENCCAAFSISRLEGGSQSRCDTRSQLLRSNDQSYRTNDESGGNQRAHTNGFTRKQS